MILGKAWNAEQMFLSLKGYSLLGKTSKLVVSNCFNYIFFPLGQKLAGLHNNQFSKASRSFYHSYNFFYTS